jgi:hypothetical protein
MNHPASFITRRTAFAVINKAKGKTVVRDNLSES